LFIEFVEVVLVDDILSLVYSPMAGVPAGFQSLKGGVGVLWESERDVVASHDAVDSRQNGVQGNKSLKHDRESGNRF
jgi:hypothetical protein